MTPSAIKKLALCLLFCRLAVFIVFFVFTILKFIHPDFGANITTRHYKMPFITEGIITAFGVFELGLVIAFVTGFWKRGVRFIILLIAVANTLTPRVMGGYVKIFQDIGPEPMILLVPGICVAVCAFAVYYLRDYDTLWSIRS